MDILAPRVRIPDAEPTKALDLYAVTPWKNLPLASGWSNVGGLDATAQYRLTPGGRVACKGLIQQTGLLALGGLIATFPVGFRPLERRSINIGLSVGTAVSIQKFFLLANGQLTYQGASLTLSTIQISLEPIEFDAEQ